MTLTRKDRIGAHVASTIDTTKMPPKEVVNFTNKLTYDDEFRSELRKNPREVLARHGVDVSDEQLPPVNELPSKEVLEQAMTDITLGSQFRQRPMLGFFWGIWFFLFLAFLAPLRRRRRRPEEPEV